MKSLAISAAAVAAIGAAAAGVTPSRLRQPGSGAAGRVRRAAAAGPAAAGDHRADRRAAGHPATNLTDPSVSFSNKEQSG